MNEYLHKIDPESIQGSKSPKGFCGYPTLVRQFAESPIESVRVDLEKLGTTPDKAYKALTVAARRIPLRPVRVMRRRNELFLVKRSVDT